MKNALCRLNMEKISIIVPIYNAENYIQQCIESVINQTFENWELVLVDDGSIDSSPLICKKYVNKKIKYIRKINTGVADTRNVGIKNATGEWLFFLDADDLLPNHALELLIDAAIMYKADIVQGKINHGENDIFSDYNNSRVFLFESCEIIKMLLSPYKNGEFKKNKKAHLLNSTQGCYAKLYNAKFIKINGIEFENQLGLGEDLIFYYNVLKSVDKVVVIDVTVYFYRISNSSVTQSFNPCLPKMFIKFHDYLKIELDKEYNKTYRDEWLVCLYLHLKLVMIKYYWQLDYKQDYKNINAELEYLYRLPLLSESLIKIKTKFTYKKIFRYRYASYLLKMFFFKHKLYKIMYLVCTVDGLEIKFKYWIKNIIAFIKGNKLPG